MIIRYMKSLTVFLAFIALAGCSGGTSSLERSIITSLTKVGVISPDGPARRIDYRPRAPLVLPSSNNLSAPVLPPENKKLSPRELAKVYFPDQSKVTLEQYEVLLAKRRELEKNGQGIRKLKIRANDTDKKAYARYIRQSNLTVPRESYFKPMRVPRRSRARSEDTDDSSDTEN